jgi:hypothetical protein
MVNLEKKKMKTVLSILIRVGKNTTEELFFQNLGSSNSILDPLSNMMGGNHN